MATGAAGRGKVKDIASDAEFQRELVTAEDKVVVVNFTASWCGPCKKIAPAFDRLSAQYSSAVFVKVDVDVCRNTARRYEVGSTPTFLFFQNRERIKDAEVKGANEVGLEAAIIRVIRTASETSGSEVTTIAKLSVPGQFNLSSLVDHSGSECLNESDNCPFPNCLRPDESVLESDCDEQLILMISFTQSVKLHTIQIIGPTDGRAPKTVKLFINQPQTLDFDTAEKATPVQEFSLTEDDVHEDSKIPLSFVKFQNVQNVAIFIPDNQGGKETTVLQYLGLFGTPLDTTNMKEFKRVRGEKGEKHE